MRFILCCPSHYVFSEIREANLKTRFEICNEEMVVFGVLGHIFFASYQHFDFFTWRSGSPLTTY